MQLCISRMKGKKHDILLPDAQFHLWNLTVNLSPLTLTSLEASMAKVASSLDSKWTNAYLKRSIPVLDDCVNIRSLKRNYTTFSHSVSCHQSLLFYLLGINS